MGSRPPAMRSGCHAFVDREVVLHHALDGEAFLEDFPAAPTVDPR